MPSRGTKRQLSPTHKKQVTSNKDKRCKLVSKRVTRSSQAGQAKCQANADMGNACHRVLIARENKGEYLKDDIVCDICEVGIIPYVTYYTCTHHDYDICVDCRQREITVNGSELGNTNKKDKRGSKKSSNNGGNNVKTSSKSKLKSKSKSKSKSSLENNNNSSDETQDSQPRGRGRPRKKDAKKSKTDDINKDKTGESASAASSKNDKKRVKKSKSKSKAGKSTSKKRNKEEIDSNGHSSSSTDDEADITIENDTNNDKTESKVDNNDNIKENTNNNDAISASPRLNSTRSRRAMSKIKNTTQPPPLEQQSDSPIPSNQTTPNTSDHDNSDLDSENNNSDSNNTDISIVSPKNKSKGKQNKSKIKNNDKSGDWDVNNKRGARRHPCVRDDVDNSETESEDDNNNNNVNNNENNNDRETDETEMKNKDSNNILPSKPAKESLMSVETFNAMKTHSKKNNSNNNTNNNENDNQNDNNNNEMKIDNIENNSLRMLDLPPINVTSGLSMTSMTRMSGKSDKSDKSESNMIRIKQEKGESCENGIVKDFTKIVVSHHRTWMDKAMNSMSDQVGREITPMLADRARTIMQLIQHITNDNASILFIQLNEFRRNENGGIKMINIGLNGIIQSIANIGVLYQNGNDSNPKLCIINNIYELIAELLSLCTIDPKAAKSKILKMLNSSKSNRNTGLRDCQQYLLTQCGQMMSSCANEYKREFLIDSQNNENDNDNNNDNTRNINMAAATYFVNLLFEKLQKITFDNIEGRRRIKLTLHAEYALKRMAFCHFMQQMTQRI